MKDSAIYRRAAAFIATCGCTYGSCTAVAEAAGVTFPRSLPVTPQEIEYESLFSPNADHRKNCAWWGQEWAPDSLSDLINCRVIALCLMAAIAESEGR